MKEPLIMRPTATGGESLQFQTAVVECYYAKPIFQKKILKKKSGTEFIMTFKPTKAKLGDLGSGNHFLDALESYKTTKFLF